jgi:hypothetical protein
MYKGLHHAIARCDAMASEDSSHSKRISKVLNHSHAFEPINFPPEMSEGPKKCFHTVEKRGRFFHAMEKLCCPGIACHFA